MLRQAARDVLHASESWAWDGAEFLNYTGIWLCEHFFAVEPQTTRKELLRLLRTRPEVFGGKERLRDKEDLSEKAP